MDRSIPKLARSAASKTRNPARTPLTCISLPPCRTPSSHTWYLFDVSTLPMPIGRADHWVLTRAATDSRPPPRYVSLLPSFAVAAKQTALS
jgi:hypothetical protein